MSANNDLQKPDNITDVDRAGSFFPQKQLTLNELHHLCDPISLNFQTTDELPDLQNVIGQPRAFRALELGSEVIGPGYNTFVMGIPGSGRTTLTKEYLLRKAKNQPSPDDWCYVINFDNPQRPKAIRLASGVSAEFQSDIHNLMQRCDQEISRVFSSEEYTQERDRLVNELKKAQETEFIRLQDYVQKYNFVIVRTTFGFVLAPSIQGKPLKEEEVEALTQEQRVKLSQLQEKLSVEVEKTIERLRSIEKTANTELSQLNERTVLYLLKPLVDRLLEKYTAYPSVIDHIKALQDDIVQNADRFRKSSDGPSDPSQLATFIEWMHRYEVNVLVQNNPSSGAPVLLETHPTYNNLLGRIEHEAIMGATRTDFTMIRAGAIHRANGGYLVIPARDLLMNPYAWEGLKRVMRDQDIRMSELAVQFGLLSTITLEPEPIPLDVKIILVGTPVLYYLLRNYDEDFAKLFKVRAEFATTMERTADTEHEYALYVKSVLEDNRLPPFDSSAVARIIEFGSRLAEDQNKLSTRFGKIADLVREAAYWSAKNQSAATPNIENNNHPHLQTSPIVGAIDVDKAIAESIYRSNLIEDRLQEMIIEGVYLIDTDGKKPGQINALSVLSLGDYAFGRPTRVTAIAAPGKGGVVDIERQAELGGRIHTKGVLILNGLLNKKYCHRKPLSLSASLTFEQSYEEIEGDSASAAEFLALVSAIADIPLRQDRAITGSINQQGQIQAIGGVNEKVEGFFAVCQERGLSGKQGVIIPASNIKNLMLNKTVSKAVEDKKFNIWAIEMIDQAIELLTDLSAGTLEQDGSYTAGSFNAIVTENLKLFAEAFKSESAPENNKSE